MSKKTSRKSGVQKNVNLGDTSTDEESFHSPERDDQHTDYGFDAEESPENLDYAPSTSRQAANRRNTSRSSNRLSQNVADHSSPTRSSPRVQAVAKKSTAQKQPPVQKPKPVKAKRKQTNPLRREQNFWKDVNRLANITTNLIPKMPFSRLVREIIYAHSQEVNRITYEALITIQESTELYITQVLTDAYLLTLHRGRVTLSVKDIQLLKVLKIDKNLY